jgi:outer membrane protein TolC
MPRALPVRPARTRRNVSHHRLAAGAAALLLALAPPGAAARERMPGASVESFLEIARDENPEWASMRHEAAAAGERTGPAGSLPDPMFRIELRDFTNEMSGASPSLLPSRVGSTKYTLVQPVPFYGKRGLRQEAAAAEAESAQRRAENTWLEVAARIHGAFAQYYYVAHNMRLAREVLDLLTRLESVAQARYASGLAAQQDAIRAQLEQTALRAELVMLENERHHQEARLNALMSRPIRAPLAEPERLRPLPPAARLKHDDLEQKLEARNPRVAAEAARVRAMEKGVELTDRNRYPDFAVGLSPIQTGSRISEWELMFEVSIPLQQDSRRAQEREARAMLEAARARRDAVMHAAHGELSENLGGLEAARSLEAIATTTLLPQAELAFQSALAGYENGKVDFATLLDAQRQIRRAKQEGLKARAESRARLAEIERLVGEPL